MLDLAGEGPDPERRGKSLLPAVGGEKFDGHEAVFGELTMLGKRVAPVRMVRTKRWKYNFYLGHGEELYDMESDPWEMTNLATSADHAKIKAEMHARLIRFIEETNDPIFTQQPTDNTGEPFTTVPIEVPKLRKKSGLTSP